MTNQVDATLKERGNRYGTFAGHSAITHQLFHTALSHAGAHNVELNHVQQEALHMICHKIGRIVNGDPNYDDSWHDIAGYAELVVKHLNGEDL